ncbi:MAG: clan AA aspartic protease [Bryobacterales bacterium]|nr:clan AA aspartic protease [Bryobacterales bacterium]
MWMLILLTALLNQLPATRLEFRNGYPIVSAFLNGQGPYRLLVDTGNSSSTVTPEVAHQIGLAPTHSAVVSSIGGDRTLPGATTLIRVGTLLTSAELLIATLPGLHRLGGNLHGILGQDFLNRSPYLIDYAGRRMLFNDDAATHAQTMPAPLPFTSINGRIAIQTRLNDSPSPSRLVLDSGASHLILYCARRCPHLASVVTAAVVTNVGSIPVRTGILHHATLGPLQFRNRPAALIESPPTQDEADGLIPAQWFQAIYVDPARSEIRLQASGRHR